LEVPHVSNVLSQLNELAAEIEQWDFAGGQENPRYQSDFLN